MHLAALITGFLVVGTIALGRLRNRRASTNRDTAGADRAVFLPDRPGASGPPLRDNSDPTGAGSTFSPYYGPLSIFGLLTVWAGGLITGFALLLGSQQAIVSSLPGDSIAFDLFYLSGSSLFTLGLGDVAPHDKMGRLLTVVEAGLGLGLLTWCCSYLPVLYGSFSRREVRLTLLDTWAGSPPAAARSSAGSRSRGDRAALDEFLKEWEYWCSEVLESHLSYPVVAYFRSQHLGQSWVSALTTVLDTSALLKVGVAGLPTWRAHRDVRDRAARGRGPRANPRRAAGSCRSIACRPTSTRRWRWSSSSRPRVQALTRHRR